MGVEIPEIKYKKENIKAEFSIHKTTTAFDEASVDMHNITYLIYELAQVETSVFRLAQEIKKTQKRANALNKIQIPKYTEIVTEIENILAEKEREDFFRLKKVKDRKEKIAKEEMELNKNIWKVDRLYGGLFYIYFGTKYLGRCVGSYFQDDQYDKFVGSYFQGDWYDKYLRNISKVIEKILFICINFIRYNDLSNRNKG